MKVNMHEAKTRLSQLVAAAEKGEPVILCRDGVPVAEVRALRRSRARTATDTSDLGPPTDRAEALAPISPEDWGDWAGG
jgi:antitoxin (DNA-binding transcriptional repressor) of toxin-antitoxin stability system